MGRKEGGGRRVQDGERDIPDSLKGNTEGPGTTSPAHGRSCGGAEAPASKLLRCSLQEACARQYCFLTLWRLLGVLPPSKTYMNQLAMNSPEMSERDILHTLRWSSRLRVSSYVDWIKVPLSLLLRG